MTFGLVLILESIVTELTEVLLLHLVNPGGRLVYQPCRDLEFLTSPTVTRLRCQTSSVF